MLIVPVIDIKGDLVVHARQGDRSRYEPIVTPLSRSPEPAAVLDGLLAVAPFAAVYIADLDAITARQPMNPVIERLADRHPMLAFWVDAGISSPVAAAALLANGRLHPVIGSESQSDWHLVEQLRDQPRVLLSLDFRGNVGITRLVATGNGWGGVICDFGRVKLTDSTVTGNEFPDEFEPPLLDLFSAKRPKLTNTTCDHSLGPDGLTWGVCTGD